MGTLTRPAAEGVLVRRFGGAQAQLLVVCGCSTAADGTNPDAADALADGLREMGLAPATALVLLDADLQACPDGRLAELLDRAELRLARTLRNRLDITRATFRVGAGSEVDVNRVRDTLDATIAGLDTRIARLYGDRASSVGSAPMTDSVPAPLFPYRFGRPGWPGW